MKVPPALVTAFPASAGRLLDLTRRQVDDGMLAEIAAADYGQDIEAHLAALVPIRDQGRVPAALRWHPGEVLELIRWSQPEDPAWKPGGTGRRGHQMRAFACAALLRAAAEPENSGLGNSEDSSLVQCIGSALFLGQEMLEAVAQFFTWRIPHLGSDCSEWLAYPLGLLVVATHLRDGRLEEEALGEVAECLLAEEAACYRECGYLPGEEGCLLAGLFSVKDSMWKPHARELIRQAQGIRRAEAREMLDFVGSLVLEL